MILAGGLFDILDGVVARTKGKESRFGAFLDSVLDRYSDALILSAISLNSLVLQNIQLLYVCFGCIPGSFLVSYARARAEGLGVNCKNGLMERPERLVLISAGAIFGVMEPALWVLLVLTHLTVVQRIHLVWRSTAKHN